MMSSLIIHHFLLGDVWAGHIVFSFFFSCFSHFNLNRNEGIRLIHSLQGLK